MNPTPRPTSTHSSMSSVRLYASGLCFAVVAGVAARRCCVAAVGWANGRKARRKLHPPWRGVLAVSVVFNTATAQYAAIDRHFGSCRRWPRRGSACNALYLPAVWRSKRPDTILGNDPLTFFPTFFSLCQYANLSTPYYDYNSSILP